MFVLFCLGLALSGYALLSLWKIYKRRNWPSTVGKVLEFQAQTARAAMRFWFSRGLFRQVGGQTLEQPERIVESSLGYIFVVEGYKFIGNRLSSWRLNFLSSNSVTGLEPGEKVKIFYCPSNPHQAFLMHAYGWPAGLILLLGLTIISITLFYY